MPATVVELGLTIAGDISSFGSAQREGLLQTLRATLNCRPPHCHITLRVSSGSVAVNAILTIPDALEGTSGVAAAATAAGVQAAANALVAQPPAAISSSLGVSVEAAAPIAVAQAVVPLVVAPPPPEPPPPPPLPPPSSHPSPPQPSPPPVAATPAAASPVAASPSPLLTSQSEQSGTQDSGSMGFIIVIIILAVLLLLVGIAFATWCIVRSRKQQGVVTLQSSKVTVTSTSFQHQSRELSAPEPDESTTRADTKVEVPSYEHFGFAASSASATVEMPTALGEESLAETSEVSLDIALAVTGRASGVLPPEEPPPTPTADPGPTWGTTTQMQELVSMGFSSEAAADTLQQTHGDAEAALEILLADGAEETAGPRAAAEPAPPQQQATTVDTAAAAVAPEPETQSNVGFLGSIGRAFSRQLSFRAEPEKEQEATNPSMTSI